MVRSRCIDSSNSHIYAEPPDCFKVYNRHSQELIGTEEMDISSHPSVFLISLATNDKNNRVPSNNESITFDNDTVMKIDQADIDTHLSLSNQLSIEEEDTSLSNSTNLKEEKELPDNTSFYEKIGPCSQDFEVLDSSKVDNRNGILFYSNTFATI